MALSKDVINPIWPKDFSTIVREGRSADDADFTPGTAVVRVNNLLVACDTGTAVHLRLPVEVVWVDGSVRHDAARRYELDGSVRQEYTTICGDFIAEVAASAFTATPEAGDIIAKSATAGKFDPLDAAQMATLFDTVEELAPYRTCGVVVGAGEKAGFYLCHFRL